MVFKRGLFGGVIYVLMAGVSLWAAESVIGGRRW